MDPRNCWDDSLPPSLAAPDSPASPFAVGPAWRCIADLKHNKEKKHGESTWNWSMVDFSMNYIIYWRVFKAINMDHTWSYHLNSYRKQGLKTPTRHNGALPKGISTTSCAPGPQKLKDGNPKIVISKPNHLPNWKKNGWYWTNHRYLVGGIPTPLKNMTSSVGMMVLPTGTWPFGCLEICVEYNYLKSYWCLVGNGWE